jgi:hypothetical protein
MPTQISMFNKHLIPSSWETKARGSWVQGFPDLYSKFEASLDYLQNPVSKIKKNLKTDKKIYLMNVIEDKTSDQESTDLHESK